MNKFLLTPILASMVVALISFTNKQNSDVVNYYSISPTIVYDNTDYNLAWSAHPNESYYKHEYVPRSESVENFHHMILLDFIQQDIPVRTAVESQVKRLIERKKSDDVCNYSLRENYGEYILDFVMSESSDSDIRIVEWSAYHYKPYTDKAGHKGVLLFGISRRAYKYGVISFLKSLKDLRNSQLTALSQYPIPDIQVK